MYIYTVCAFLVGIKAFMYSQDSLLLQFYYKVQVYVNNLRTWLGEELQCLT